MKKVVILLLFSLQLFAQDLDTMKFYYNIKDRIFLVKEHDDIYFDLNRKSLTQTSSRFIDAPEEVFVGLNYNIFEGSFLNKSQKEYLFLIFLDEEAYGFFSHAENWGQTTLIYVFDENYNQISNVYFQDSKARIVDIQDVEKDGIDEVFIKSNYGMMGCYREWINVYSGNFDSRKELIDVISFQTCLESGVPGEKVTINAEYRIENKSIVFDTRLDYYISMGNDDNRYIRSEMKKDVYQGEKGIFRHIKDKDNVDWNDEKLWF